MFYCFYRRIHVLVYYVLIHSASQLQQCLINLLTYLFTYFSRYLEHAAAINGTCVVLMQQSENKWTECFHCVLQCGHIRKNGGQSMAGIEAESMLHWNICWWKSVGLENDGVHFLENAEMKTSDRGIGLGLVTRLWPMWRPEKQGQGGKIGLKPKAIQTCFYLCRSTYDSTGLRTGSYLANKITSGYLTWSLCLCIADLHRIVQSWTQRWFDARTVIATISLSQTALPESSHAYHCSLLAADVVRDLVKLL